MVHGKKRLIPIALIGVIAGAALWQNRLARVPAFGPRACSEMRFEGDSFTVCAFNRDQQELALVWADAKGSPYGGLDTYAAALSSSDQARVRYAMNAGMYDDQRTPIGLYVEQGQQRHVVSTKEGPGNFHLMPNGIFSADQAGLHIETTPDYLARKPDSLWATQSGPMLVIAGKLHPAIQDDGQSHYIRNAVGIRDANHAYFVISDTAVSFGKLARLFRDKLGCANALYLDGAVSSLWEPGSGRMDTDYPLGPMIVVRAKGQSPLDPQAK